MKYCLKDMLGDNQQKSLFYFLDAITACMAESHNHTDHDALQERVDTALALLETDFPSAVQVVLRECRTLWGEQEWGSNV